MPNFNKDKSKFQMKNSAFKQYKGDRVSSPLKSIYSKGSVYSFQMPKFLEGIGDALSGIGAKGVRKGRLKPTTIAQRIKQRIDLKDSKK